MSLPPSPPPRAPSQGPVGVAAALSAAHAPQTAAQSTLFTRELSLRDRVALVSGANRGIGLELAMALVEAGARAVYCVDLPDTPGEDFVKVRRHLDNMGGVQGRLEYVSADVRDQDKMWRIGETIGDKEGRMDICVAAAGIIKPDADCLAYTAKMFQDVMEVNVNGVLFTAQAAGRQMDRFGKGGSIILVGSMSGSVANIGQNWLSYNTSKSAVLQMARSMAVELASKRIRVNTLSPGYMHTNIVSRLLAPHPGLLEKWSSQNPTGRIGRPEELRGVIVWLASDASSYCTGSDIIVDGGHRAW